MTPNFEENDFILTDKVTYRFRKPERGDVIVFKSPQDPNYDYIKRVIALPNERVKLQNGHYYIFTKDSPKGVLLNEPYLPSTAVTPPGSYVKEGELITVGENQYFVNGDNRAHSSDSREWGTVPLDSIIGRAWLRYWPVIEFGMIPRVDYLLKSGSN